MATKNSTMNIFGYDGCVSLKSFSRLTLFWLMKKKKHSGTFVFSGVRQTFFCEIDGRAFSSCFITCKCSPSLSSVFISCGVRLCLGQMNFAHLNHVFAHLCRSSWFLVCIKHNSIDVSHYEKNRIDGYWWLFIFYS